MASKPPSDKAAMLSAIAAKFTQPPEPKPAPSETPKAATTCPKCGHDMSDETPILKRINFPE